MYVEYGKQSGDPLAQLLALMQRYLKAFTAHTEYNVRDFGTSYLDSTMPVDLAGRAARDCGVYALTVAYEVYRTASKAKPKLPVNFVLYTFLEHVALLIHHRDKNQFYIVNNDEISGPTAGAPTGPEAQAQMAATYGQTVGRGMLVAPAVPIKLGSSDVADSTFKHDAWLGFQAGTAWGMDQGPTRQATYAEYYADMKTFDRDAAELQLGLDALSAHLQKLPDDATRKDSLDKKLPTIVNRFKNLPGLFDKYIHAPKKSPQALNADPRSPAASILVKSMANASYLEFFKSGTTPGDPLTRLGKAIMLHERLQGTLDPLETQWTAWLRRTASYAGKLTDYDKAGRPLQF
jgi:hypothetical protein